MKRILLYILLLIGTGCKVIQPSGSRTEPKPDSSSLMTPVEVSHGITDTVPSIEKEDAITSADTLTVISLPDSLENGSIMLDSLATASDSLLFPFEEAPAVFDSIPRKRGALEAPVDYTATDSIVWTADNMAYLYGESNVKYQNIELKSEYIQINMDESILNATYGLDSLGNEFGLPVFTEGDQVLEAKIMDYNFKSREAAAKYLVTQQGEGRVIANIAKKMDNDVINMADGIYTTCDAESPHFYFRMTKAKVRLGKDLVSGPVWLVIEDVPLFPVVLPFLFFPFTDSYSSGIIPPTFDDELNRGFSLRNGGYYFALGDYFDLRLTGELFTKGTWGVSGQTAYRKRYKYSGNFSFSYLATVTGDKGLDDYQKTKDFSVKLSHSQDPKANPYQTISASVDYSTSSYDRNQLNSLYTPAATQNNKGSSVSYSRRFPNSPFSLSASMNINQRSRDSSVSVTLPDMSITMSRIYPLKRKNAIGKDRWYEKISINYNAQIKNSISTKDNLLFQSNLIKDWKNGIQHRTDINATYSILNHINLSPNISYTERWYSHRVEQSYNPQLRRLVPTDTIYGFNRVYNYSASVSASTTVYTIFTPIKSLQKFVKMIRLRSDPSISFSAVPDFGDRKYGFYNYYTYENRYGQNPVSVSGSYSPFEGQLFGVPGRGKSGSISFSLDNNLEAKIPDSNEASGERKISLIDKLSGSMSYNLVADSFNWSNLNTNIRLKLTRSYTLNLNGVFETYSYDYDEIRGANNEVTIRPRRVNKPRWTVGKGIGRLMSTGTSFSYTLNNDTFKKLSGGRNANAGSTPSNGDNLGEDEYDPNNPGDLSGMERNANPATDTNRRNSLFGRRNQSDGEYDVDGYYNVVIPWSLSFNYNLSVGYNTQKFDPVKKEYAYRFVHAFSFNGNISPTKNWRINFNATYDFENKKISYMTSTISRSMHCWSMSASVIPVGPMKSYSFSISANSSMLKDLKHTQSSSPYGGQTWY